MLFLQLTDRSENKNRNYPVMVIIPGEDYKNGDSMLYPAHILASKEVLVVTFNYRLGALGITICCFTIVCLTIDRQVPGAVLPI
jgi:carboxylesterase type B